MENIVNDLQSLFATLKESTVPLDDKNSKRLVELSEMVIEDGSLDKIDTHFLHTWLNYTGKSNFLRNLPDEELRERWAECAFKFIQDSNYSFNDLLRYRMEEHPQKVLFMDMSSSNPTRYSYEQVWRRTKELAASIYKSVQERPRVAIFCENAPESAIIDLACLAWDIPVSPLNVHFSTDELLDIFKRMSYNVVITDSLDNIAKIEKIAKTLHEKPVIMHTNETIKDITQYRYITKYAKTFNSEEIEKILNKRRRMAINQVATIMFTSGSTGQPKGVSFTIYNLVSKRFARAAALPSVGENEVLLCFLPLFHTFGRYLEMMGMIYWSGTYVFVGSPSTETLLSLFPKVNPTGFISVPIRWQQLYEKIMEEIELLTSSKDISATIKKVIGSNLRWGLSAAGYLDPKIFMFFQKHGVQLCSGFGMTEATGGITMTPPTKYVVGTVGKPLPGVKTYFKDTSEMLISGHYVAHYLDDKPFGSEIPFPISEEIDFQMPTGDVFNVNDKGFYEIIDRVKDIYKNSKGQTVSPKNVETKFEGVPGIKRVFLAGDGKAYNTLLIVPDFADPLFSDEEVKNEPKLYYQRIISAANQSLAPYERVVNFAILDRDFDIQFGELTPKGSLSRKIIEKNFTDVIASLYQQDFNELFFESLKIIIPRWFYRDLSILEDDIVVYEHGLINKETSLCLNIEYLGNDKYLIGDLIYKTESRKIDLGAFALQPKLWFGNVQLMNFAPCKVNWDYPLGKVSPVVECDFSYKRNYSDDVYSKMKNIKNNNLVEINKLVCDVFYQEDQTALKALESLQDKFYAADERISFVIRLRIQALAYHRFEEIRCLAYRIILQEETVSDNSKIFPAFLESGLTFLNKESIEIIAKSNFERRRLNALRKRLLMYREQLEWPQTDIFRKQMEAVFQLLVDFVKYKPEYYPPVRVELSNWVLHKSDIELSRTAEKYFWELSNQYEESLENNSIARFPLKWLRKIVFEDTLSIQEVENIKKVLIDTTFLKQSVILTFDEYDFDMEDIAENGIWISKINSINQNQVYRVSINTNHGKHYDLQMILKDDLKDKQNLETILWLIAVAGYPDGPNVLPALGCARPELESRTMIFLGDLTVWERIRQISSTRMLGQPLPKLNILKRLYTEGIAAFFRAWRNSGCKIVPGAITPSNVIVSDLDFRDGATILSLAGWNMYQNSQSMIDPIINNFFKKAVHHYAWTKNHLEINWIFDAAIEGLGETRAMQFFGQMKDDLMSDDIEFCGKYLLDELKKYLENSKEYYYHPLPLTYAIDKYHEWQNINPNAIPAAKEQSIVELYNLYRLDRYPEIARYQLYRHTYFVYKGFYIRSAFDKLLQVMNKDRTVPATQLIDLSDLQGVLEDADDREVFSKMVFPGFKKSPNYDILKFKAKQNKQIIVSSAFKDKFGDEYLFREPQEPAEIGMLYRLFYKEKFSKSISEQDQFIVLFDANDRVAGGITYQIKEDNTCILDGIVLASQFQGRGLGRAMMEDFINRMQSLGIDIIKTTFFVDDFYSKLGFTVDKRWGLLVRILNRNKYYAQK